MSSSSYGFLASFGIFMGIVQWIFYLLGITSCDETSHVIVLDIFTNLHRKYLVENINY